jgi:hypothetical protein
MDKWNNAVRQEITMTKGDTLAFNFQVQGLGGVTPTGIYFTCREKPESETFYFQRLLGNGVTLLSYDAETDTNTYGVRVRPDQTENLSAGRYFYDLQMRVDDDVLTLMKGHINIEWDVTRG